MPRPAPTRKRRVLRAFRHAEAGEASIAFDDWLAGAIVEPAGRGERLAGWVNAPAARFAHPREEHLLPLMIAAGASDGPGSRIYGERVMDLMISGFAFA